MMVVGLMTVLVIMVIMTDGCNNGSDNGNNNGTGTNKDDCGNDGTDNASNNQAIILINYWVTCSKQQLTLPENKYTKIEA